MSDSISKTQRWLDLLSFLVGRRYPVDVDELMKNVPAYAEGWSEGDDTARATVRRMFERDKDELRELGIPLETVRYSVDWGEHIEGYRLRSRDFYLPYLRILSEGRDAAAEEAHGESVRGGAPYAGGAGESPMRGPKFELSTDEASMALDALDAVIGREAFPLQDAAREARRKLTFDLDPGAVERTPIHWIDPPGADAIVENLDALTDALLRRKRVRFSYYGIHRDERSEREVEPWGLLFQHSHWYLLGRDPDSGESDGDDERHGERHGERRIFRVARMEDVAVKAPGSATPDFEQPEDFSLDDLRGREAWELGDEDAVTARVRFRFPRSLWAERNGMGSLVRREEDGAQVRAFSVLQPNPFLRWVLSMGGEARVLDPPELVRAMREMAAEIARLYGNRSDEPGEASESKSSEPADG